MGSPTQALRNEQLRVTPTRGRVLIMLGRSQSLTAHQIHVALADDSPGLSLSTVDRTLRSLQRAGLVDSTTTPDRTTFWHVPHRGQLRFMCRSCGQSWNQSAPALLRKLTAQAAQDGLSLPDPVTVPAQCEACST